MAKTCVVVGGRHAASQFAHSLRQEGWDDNIVLIGEEPSVPYYRPALSKEYLAGDKSLDEIMIRPPKVYEDLGVDCWLFPRQNLPACTTCEPFKMWKTSASICEPAKAPSWWVAAILARGGCRAQQVGDAGDPSGDGGSCPEAGYRPVIADFYSQVHREEGVDVRCGVTVTEFQGNGQVERVVCSDGSHWDARFVVIGVGITPNVELAASASLEIKNGIAVDSYSRTNDADIVAAGDCTSHVNPIYKRRVRLESVQNATDQARIAAATVCGREKEYNNVPWFWSDQYALKLQIAGLSEGYEDMVMRRDPQNHRSMSVFYLKRGKVIAVDAVNRPAEFMMGKRVISEKRSVDRNRLADESVHIRELL